ncbi:MAG TPA: hypothetical protein GXX15_08810 [Clostridia bacterium]|nr:hypothetical protein [Clostridia bacterium]
MPKKKPIPSTLQYRYSKTVGHKYWANVCPYCGSVQGDWFLHEESEGPFFVCNLEADNSFNYKISMLRIAVYAEKMGVL